MSRSRTVLSVVALLFAASACASNRYVANRDGRIFDVTFVNNCTPFIVRIWIDDEWQNRMKIDVKARAVGSQPRSFPIPEGRHFIHVEWKDVEEIQIREGTFTVTGPDRYRLC